MRRPSPNPQATFSYPVPAFVSPVAGESYRGMFPMIGDEMAQEPCYPAGITIVTGKYVDWADLHVHHFGVAPRGWIRPEYSGMNKFLYEAWIEWVDHALEYTSMGDMHDVPRGADGFLSSLLGGLRVRPLRVERSACHTCVRPGSVIPIIARFAHANNGMLGTRPWVPGIPNQDGMFEVRRSHDPDHDLESEMEQAAWEAQRDKWASEMAIPEAARWSLTDLVDAGYEEDASVLEEEAADDLIEHATRMHSENVRVPGVIRDFWQAQAQHYLFKQYEVRRFPQACNIHHYTSEGIMRWLGNTDR